MNSLSAKRRPLDSRWSGTPGRVSGAVTQEVEQQFGVQRWLAAGQADSASGRRKQTDDGLGAFEQPGVIAVLRRLRAHEAVVVALLGE